MAADAWVTFRRDVLADRGLQEQLLATSGRTEFVTLVVRLAGRRGLAVDPDDVEEALAEAKWAWRARWI